MAERPLILFGRPELATKAKRYGGSPNVKIPSHDRQVQRLQPNMMELQRAIDANKILMQQSAVGIEPEKTLVFVTNGDLESLYIAIKNLGKENEGVEWLFDLVEDDVQNTDDFYKTDKHGDEVKDGTFSCKIFCIMTNNRALEEMLSLWKHYEVDKKYKFPNGKTGLKHVFDNLIEMHFWGIKERIEETGVLEAWTDDLQLDASLSEVKCEIELFYRKSKPIQQSKENDLIAYVQEVGGKVISKCIIDGIAYHAILVSLPRQLVEDILSHREVKLIKVEQIMFFRPVGQSVSISDESIIDSNVEIERPMIIDSTPIIALFDGLPQENHPILTDMLIVDDPDNYASTYVVSDRKHGTSMASLIAYGNLEANNQYITHKIYVRPILKPVAGLNSNVEEIPDDSLFVDKIHEAVRRLFEPVAGMIAPDVKIINLSIGIQTRLFYNAMSPLARLLDWLSFKYKVLFIVSAGNHSEAIDLEMKFDDFAKLNMNERDNHVIKIINNNSRNHKLLSPAESMNALTVGATFADKSTFVENPRQILLCSDGSPNPVSSFGRGFNRSIKPDILFEGGRNTVISDIRPGKETIARWRELLTRAPGTLSAAPFVVATGTQKAMYSFGTSNSTAQITHEASRCYDTLMGIFQSELNYDIPKDYAALLIKAMLVHGAEWGGLGDAISGALSLVGRKQISDYIHKWIGYGVPNIERTLECAKNRITLIGYGELKNGEAHLYDLPLPFDFNKEKIVRRLTATLTHFTPIIPTRQKYRTAQLWYTIEDAKKNLIDSRQDANDRAVVRGTVQHEIYENDEIVVWGEDDKIRLRVNCRGDADEEFTETIHYALMVSFEIKNGVDLDVYERVTNKIKSRDTIDKINIT